jgi:hypothetical protein
MLLYRNPYICSNLLKSAIYFKFLGIVFPPYHWEMLGTCPVNSLDLLSAKNGQDLSLYATL